MVGIDHSKFMEIRDFRFVVSFELEIELDKICLAGFLVWAKQQNFFLIFHDSNRTIERVN